MRTKARNLTMIEKPLTFLRGLLSAAVKAPAALLRQIVSPKLEPAGQGKQGVARLCLPDNLTKSAWTQFAGQKRKTSFAPK